MAVSRAAGRTRGIKAQKELQLGSVIIFTNAGVPTDGTSGTKVSKAGPGSICVDTTNKKLYINGNTQASPTWKLVTSAS